jgi:hypothetical protein
MRDRLSDRVVWNVSSTAAGGGVAEMLHRLLGYARGIGFDARWIVLQGDPDFFRITKRLHNALHGERGDGAAPCSWPVSRNGHFSSAGRAVPKICSPLRSFSRASS